MSELLIAFSGGFAAMLAALIASFSGGGLSLILFPILLAFAPFNYTSLFTVTKISSTLMTLTSSWIHFKQAKFDWKFLSYVGLMQIVGTAIGTYILQYQFNQQVFITLLGWTVLLTSIYLFFRKNIGDGLSIPRPITLFVYLEAALFCILISVLNGIFGGTGIFITIYFVTALRMSFLQSMAYTMPSFFIVNIVQTSYLVFTEWIDPRLTICVIIGSILGGWLGTKLQYLKGNTSVRFAAISIMFLIGVKTLFL